MIQKYIKLYFDNVITKSAWQRYTNGQLLLGEGSNARTCLLAKAMCNNW
ncbi:MAG: hypothetical protein ACP5MB_11445 [bacterium]